MRVVSGSVFLVLLLVVLSFTSVCAAPIDTSSPGPWLVYDFAMGWGMGLATQDQLTGAKFQVQISDGGPFKTKFTAIYKTLAWYPNAINLSEYQGKKIRVRFVASYLGRILMDYPHWGNPRIVVGALFAKTPPKEVFNFALTPMERAGGYLPDGSEFEIKDKDATFFTKLITPGLVDAKHMNLVYAGDNYICVPGKAQPGIFTGVSMSLDYLRMGGDPAAAPYTGPMPAPCFAQWVVDVPRAPAYKPAVKTFATIRPGILTPSEYFVEMQIREDVFLHQPGLIAKYDPRTVSMTVNMGPKSGQGWAFVGIETVGLPKVPLSIEKTGRFTEKDENSFGGLVVDYHTPLGYEKRVWLGLGAINKSRFDLRPADWVIGPRTLSLKFRLGFQQQFEDISSLLHNNKADIDLMLSKYAPVNWDGRVWIAAGVQGLPAGAGLKVHIKDQKRYAANPVLTNYRKQSSQFLTLEDSSLRLVISRLNGAICGMWDKSTGRKIVDECNDIYNVQKPYDEFKSMEFYDRVEAIKAGVSKSRPEAVITCTNAGLSGLTIEKRYAIEKGQFISKRVAFSTTDRDGFFIQIDSDTKLNPAFQAESSRGGDLLEKKVVAKGKVVTKTENVVLEQIYTGDSPMVISNDYKTGLAFYRYKVNDRFVLRGTNRGKSDGWTSKVFVNYVKAGKSVNGEMRWAVFAGDFTDFERAYQSLPQYRDLFKFTHPDWTKRIVCDGMYLTNFEDQQIFDAASKPQIVTYTMWFLNPPWGNWWADSDPPLRNMPSIYGVTTGSRIQSPNIRISAYTNGTFDKGSDVYKTRKDLGIRDIEGNLIATGANSDSGEGASFYFQIGNPVTRKYMQDMACDRMKKWKMDYFYADGLAATDIADWGIRGVAQSYDYLDYVRQLRKRLQEVNPENAIFTNGSGTPFVDIGYIEYREPQWQQLMSSQWRQVALEMFRNKLSEPQGHIICPTYGNMEADPTLAAYDIMYGWCGNLWVLQRLPWMQASWELRYIKMVEKAVSPKWWRTKDEVEAYGFTKGRLGIVNAIGHDPKMTRAKLTVDTGRLGLQNGKPVYAYIFEMNDPRPIKDANVENPGEGYAAYVLTDFWRLVTPNLQLTDEQKSKRAVFHTRSEKPGILFENIKCPKILTLNIPVRLGLTTSVVLTHTPAIVAEVDGKATEIGITEHADVKVTGDKSMLTVDCRANSAAIVIPNCSLKNTRVVTGWTAPITDSTWAGRPAIKVVLQRGISRVKIERK